MSGTLGHVAFAQAFKLAEMLAVLPLDFLRLVWASAFGYWLFAEVPSLVSWIGGLLIFGSASYIAIRGWRDWRVSGSDPPTRPRAATAAMRP